MLADDIDQPFILQPRPLFLLHGIEQAVEFFAGQMEARLKYAAHAAEGGKKLVAIIAPRWPAHCTKRTDA